MATTTTSTIKSPSSSLVHPKPHTAIHIAQQDATTKAIRIERDYSEGNGITKFCTDIPKALEGKITVEQYYHTIKTINTMLDSAERLSWKGVLYNMMEILTIYLLPLFLSSHYHKTIHDLLVFIDQENKTVYEKHRLRIRNPVKTAFLFIEIQDCT
ncbi:unnamed protein product [Absidia cylindrospora]